MKVSLKLGTFLASAMILQACTGSVSDVTSSGSSGGNFAGGGMGSVGSGGSPAATGGTPGNGGGTGGVPVNPGSGGAVASTGGTFVSTAPAATPTVMRLSSVQWGNSVRELLKLANPGPLETAITADAVVRFDNEADSLFIDQALRDDLLEISERLAAQVAGDPAAILRLAPMGTARDPAGRARAFIQEFGRRAYRRPLTAAEIQEYVTLFDQGPTLTTGMGAFEAGVRVTLEVFLQSPHFLYRTAIGGPAAQKRARLTDFEIASNISYALTNSMPDPALSQAADMGALKTPEAVAAQAKRLISTPLGKAAVDRFYFQFFGLGQYNTLQKNAVRFANVGPLLHTEAQQFLQHLFSQNGTFRDIFTSPVGLVNSTVAGLYGLPGTFTANSWTQVTFDPAQRPGLLTRLGFLAYFGHDGATQDSIRRGAIINQRILCRQMTAPTNVIIDPLPPPDPTRTNRELVDDHTGVGTCGASCHATFINPAGFAFENFDGFGAYRTTENGKRIDASGAYPFSDGTKTFGNVLEFNKALSDSAQAHSCYARTWTANLYSRVPRMADEVAADAVAQRSLSQNISTLDLIVALVTNDAFVTRVEGP